MRKIVKISESELVKLLKKVLKEQSFPGTSSSENMGYRERSTPSKPQIQVKAKENINPKNLKIGDGGKSNPKLSGDVKILQQKLMDLGLLKTNTMTPTGYFGPKTDEALKLYNQGKTKVPTTTQPKIKSKVPTTTQPKSGTEKVSDQVRRQIDYMKKNNILSNDRFTILDDKNNQVHAFNPGYQLVKTYYVLTGKDKGDALKTQTMTEWVTENWSSVGGKFFKSLWQSVKSGFKTNPFDEVANFIDNCYFGQEEWLLKNTPSGVFKRAGTVENFMNDWLATTFIEKDYGKRFITWTTCGGETIPFGFHGTQNPGRLKVLEAKDIQKQSCKKRQMSFGCINFKESDILDIDKFITAGQTTIWLPDATDDIIQIPQNCL